MQLVVDWDGTVTVRDTLLMVIYEFGDPTIEKPHWQISYNPLRDDDGVIIGGFHHAVDITAELRAEDELKRTQDALRQSQ